MKSLKKLAVKNYHCCILLNQQCLKYHPCCKIKSCIYKSASISSCIDVAQQDWSEVLSAPSVDEKLEIYDSIINTVVENIVQVGAYEYNSLMLAGKPLIIKV